MIEHKQTAILDPASNYMIEVEEGTAPLLKAIWNSGITICNSCQENKPGIIWIESLTAKDVEAFLTRVISGLDPVNSHEANNWLYSRIIGQNSVKTNCLLLHVYDTNSTSGGIRNYEAHSTKEREI